MGWAPFAGLAAKNLESPSFRPDPAFGRWKAYRRVQGSPLAAWRGNLSVNRLPAVAPAKAGQPRSANPASAGQLALIGVQRMQHLYIGREHENSKENLGAASGRHGDNHRLFNGIRCGLRLNPGPPSGSFSSSGADIPVCTSFY